MVLLVESEIRTKKTMVTGEENVVTAAEREPQKRERE
jgi:hypothetical protein